MKRSHSIAADESVVFSVRLVDDGAIPNNRLPLLVYRQALRLPDQDPASAIEELLDANGWGGHWRNGVYAYQHYHSTAHEVLAVFAGTATVQFGGNDGTTQELAPGDVVVIPAGVAHKNLDSSPEFRVVGAYPAGQDWDLCYGRSDERPMADANIARVTLPSADPVYGPDGPLLKEWSVG